MSTPTEIPTTSRAPKIAVSGAPVRVDGLVKTYAGVPAVDNIDLDIRAGEFLTLLGPSGSGKTTTLSMIAGFTTPTEGRVQVSGVDVTRTPPHKRNIGMVFQNYSLFPHMSVVVNVEFPLKQRGVPKAERRARAMAALEMVELAGKAQSKPGQLSGGQQQRVALARALVFSPTLLLMDEPFGALDRALREKMQIELRRIHQELGVTIVFVTHDQQEALTLSDRIAIFRQGAIAQLGTPQDLYEKPTSLHVATFLGESNLFTGTAHESRLVMTDGSELPLPDARDGAATLMVRPERVQVHAAGTPLPAGHTTLTGIVIDVTYLGRDHRIDVVSPLGPVIARIEPTAVIPRRGDQVTVSWDPATSVSFPAPSTPASTVIEEAA